MTLYKKRHIKNKLHTIKPVRSIFSRLWFWLGLLFLIVISSCFYFVLFYSAVQIKDIVISGNEKIESKDIENLISDNINKKILSIGNWGIFSKSIFLTNSSRLERELLNKFPVMETVKIHKKFFQAIEVVINERTPVAIFCPSLEKTAGAAKGECYFIDNQGIIFEPLYVAPQNMVIVRQTIDGAQIFVGEKIVQQNIIDLLLKLEKNLKDNFQIDLSEALATSPLRLNVSTSENWKIYFDLGSDADSQITKLNLLLNGELSGDKRENLRYIDLRPKDRAIVCDNKICGE